ncbi:MAG: hypothetical protein R2874_14025 [Desulfobacterales bacterium]
MTLRFPSLDIIPLCHFRQDRCPTAFRPGHSWKNFENVRTVKEATGSLDNMRKNQKMLRAGLCHPIRR